MQHVDDALDPIFACHRSDRELARAAIAESDRQMAAIRLSGMAIARRWIAEDAVIYRRQHGTSILSIVRPAA